MKEFLINALPWIIIGLTIAVVVVNYKKSNQSDNYIAEGMSLGMCMGVTMAATFSFDMGLGISLGMLCGEAIGMSVKKKK